MKLFKCLLPLLIGSSLCNNVYSDKCSDDNDNCKILVEIFKKHNKPDVKIESQEFIDQLYVSQVGSWDANENKKEEIIQNLLTPPDCDTCDKAENLKPSESARNAALIATVSSLLGHDSDMEIDHSDEEEMSKWKKFQMLQRSFLSFLLKYSQPTPIGISTSLEACVKSYDQLEILKKEIRKNPQMALPEDLMEQLTGDLDHTTKALLKKADSMTKKTFRGFVSKNQVSLPEEISNMLNDSSTD